MRILIANSQPDVLDRAVAFTRLFSEAVQAEITLLGIYETATEMDEMKDALQRAQQTLPAEIKLVQGDSIQAMTEEVEAGRYNLLVVGTYRNRFFKRSRTQVMVRQLINAVSLPVLMVPQKRETLDNILICTGGSHHGEFNAWVGGTFAAMIGAHITVLHVMSQLPLIAAAYEADLNRDAIEMMEHNTREGKHLKRVMAIFNEAGVPEGKSKAKVLHGLVVDEIKRESREGDYDLVLLGAHEVPGDKSWNELRELVQDDITGRILTVTRRPILVVKTGENGLRWPS